MKIDVLFYTRKDFGSWRKFSWFPVSLLQGKYVHCEMFVDGRILNASNKDGVIWDSVGKFVPSCSISIEVDNEEFYSEADKVVGKKYSWMAFLGLIIPKWGNDPKGMICSELVAHMIKESATDSRYRIPFIAVPPYRWTPDGLRQALENLEEHLEK